MLNKPVQAESICNVIDPLTSGVTSGEIFKVIINFRVKSTTALIYHGPSVTIILQKGCCACGHTVTVTERPFSVGFLTTYYLLKVL